MKTLVIIFAVVIAALLGILIFVPGPKNPQAPANTPSPNPAVQQTTSSDGKVVVSAPLPNDEITSPVTIRGAVTGGGWFFEASFPVKVLDGDGTVLGSAPAQAQSDWMSTGTVSFAATITFSKPKYATGAILLEKDNPSGLPRNAGELRIPVHFGTAPASVSQCRATGCSKEICSDEEIVSPCIYMSAFACYKTARCERQTNGACGWTQTAELQSCLSAGGAAQ